MSTHAFRNVEADDAMDLGDLFARVVKSVRALWGPSESDIEAVQRELGAFFWSVVGPLLSAKAHQFDSQFEHVATRANLQEFKRILNSSATRTWIERESQRSKVTALRPSKEARDPVADKFAEDIDERFKLLSPLVSAAKKRNGFRLPTKAEAERAYARFVIAALATHVASAAPAHFSGAGVERVWKACTDSMREVAALYGVADAKLDTSFDAERMDNLFRGQDAAYEKVQRTIDSSRAEEVDSSFFGEE